MHHPQETLIMSAGLGKQQIRDGDAREAATQKPSARSKERNLMKKELAIFKKQLG
jgi:hypothetical protein